MKNIKFPKIELKFKPHYFDSDEFKITTSKKAAEIFKQLFDEDEIGLFESFIVLFANRSNNVTGYYELSKGGINGTVIDIRLILTSALLHGASSLLVCHNHPSGSIEPSESDKKMTSKIYESSKLLDIQVLDHIILSGNVDSDSYFSFADNGLLY